MRIIERVARWLVLKSGFVAQSATAPTEKRGSKAWKASVALDAALARARLPANGEPARAPGCDPSAPMDPAKIYALPQPPPGVLPTGKTIAMDDATWAARAPAAQWAIQWAFHEGIGFMGFPYLAELAQRPEYRRGSEIIAKEMTRKWIELTYTSTNEDDPDAAKKTEAKLAEVEKEMKRLNVRAAFRKLTELDGFFGRSHLYLDFGAKTNDELQTSIGNGSDDISAKKIKKGSLRSLKVIEPMWTYPNQYNSSDPLDDNYYKPQNWFVQGRLINSSRLLTFVGREVSDLLKPAYTFGGLSLTQIAKPYVDNWLRARQSVSDLLHSFTVFALATDMNAVLQGDFDALEVDNFFKRIELFNLCRDNRGSFVTNKETEEFSNVSAPLSSLDKLQAQAQEQLCSVFAIPMVKLLGISPAGLNPSTDNELRCFYDWVEAQQEAHYTDPLSRVLNFIQLSLWGKIDPNIGFKFLPLWTLDALQQAQKRKADIDADDVAVNMGALDPIEVRTRIAAEEDSPYSSLDLGKDIIPPDDGGDDPDNPFGGEESPDGPGAKSMPPHKEGSVA